MPRTFRKYNSADAMGYDSTNTPTLKTQPPKQQQNVTTVNVSDTEPFVWKLGNNKLQPVPLFHLLESSAVTLEDIPTEAVTARISGFLKSRSIAATYDDNLVGRVRCQTKSSLQFVIQLWQQTSTTIIMECQRVQGSHFEINDVRHHLARAVQEGGTNETTQDTMMDDVPSKRLTSLMNLCVEHAVPNKVQEESYGASPLDICFNLLRSNVYSERRLGLESLRMLTDPTKTLKTFVESSVRAILFGQDTELLLLLEPCLDPRNNDNDPAMHLLTLQILSNSLEAATAFSSSAPSMNLLQEPFWRNNVLPVLYSHVQNANNEPLQAALSIQCLNRFLQLATQERRTTPPHHHLNLNLDPYSLQCAYQYGIQHNLSLQKESQQLLNRLGFAQQ